VKFIKSFKLRYYEHTERVNNKECQTNSTCQNGRNKKKSKATEKMD
jgi:hypothetical protein